jgi:hypothetical protein
MSNKIKMPRGFLKKLSKLTGMSEKTCSRRWNDVSWEFFPQSATLAKKEHDRIEANKNLKKSLVEKEVQDVVLNIKFK